MADTDNSEQDELIADRSSGEIRMAAFSAEESLDKLESIIKHLGIDRRSSMPQDKNCLEYRLRDAHASLQGATNELKEKGNIE